MSEACTNNTEREAPQQRGPLTHVLSVDSFDRLLVNVLSFYQKAKAAYYATDPNTPALPDAGGAFFFLRKRLTGCGRNNRMKFEIAIRETDI